MSRKKRGEERERDEVSELIQAAEDEMLLNLSINSHMSRGSSSSSYIDPDLERRFQALKSKPSKPSSKIVSPNPNPVSPNPPTTANDVDDHNLIARFAALKGSSSSSSSDNPHKSSVVDLDDQVGNNDDEDEVQKLIRWAIDAARLDPSPPSDTDDDDNDDTDGDGDDDGMNREKKGRPK